MAYCALYINSNPATTGLELQKQLLAVLVALMPFTTTTGKISLVSKPFLTLMLLVIESIAHPSGLLPCHPRLTGPFAGVKIRLWYWLRCHQQFLELLIDSINQSKRSSNRIGNKPKDLFQSFKNQWFYQRFCFSGNFENFAKTFLAALNIPSTKALNFLLCLVE